MAADPRPVRETRIALTVSDFATAVEFYRDALGLPELQRWHGPAGSGAILDAGRATIELLSTAQAALVDAVEAGGRPGGPIRLALHVTDSAALAERLVRHGAEPVGGPVLTPWGHRNARVAAPDGVQLTLFEIP